MDHDQFFKKLLTRFFDDFVRIVAPELAADLRLDQVTFLDSEGFTDFRDGSRRLLDLVAQVETLGGEPEIVLVHVEIEARARKTMEVRMWRYAMQLRLRHGRPVIPIVLYLRGGPPGVSARTVEERFGELFLGSFGYLAFGLSGSDARRFLERPEPLAWGLAALMLRGNFAPVQKKLTSLHRIAGEEALDDVGRLLLMECVETYVQLNDAEEREYQALLSEEVNREVATMEMTWSERLRQEGRQEGELRGMQTLLLDLLRQRFETVQPETERRVRSIDTAEELSRLAGEVFSGGNPPELGL